MGKEVVLVTGASGCLGQHIVKLLQEKDENISEIRVLDIVPYENKLGHAENKPMKHFVQDILDKNTLDKAFNGVHCVFHLAVVVDTSLFPQVDKMEAVNIEGTKNIIEACIKNNVPRLVFTSTVDVAIAGEHIFYGMESTTPIPSSWLMGSYAETKAKAEKIVLESSEKLLADGSSKLKALALRPTAFYGEEDQHFVTKMFKFAKEHGGVFKRVHSLDERLQITYVGNVAWAHLKAKDKMIIDDSISGEPFYITDDTQIQDIYINTRPYFEGKGIPLSDYVYPYWIVWIFLSLLCLIIKLIRPIYKIQIDVPSPGELNYVCSTFFFNRAKAILRLDYQPLYTPEEAQEKSLGFYSKCKI